MESDRLKLVAYHEAGHAVAHHFRYCERAARTLRYATIVPGNGADGHVARRRTPTFAPGPWRAPTLEQIVDELTFLYAGVVAEQRYSGTYSWKGAASDLESAARILTHWFAGSGKSTRTFVRWVWVRTEDIVERRWPAIESVAAALLERKVLTEGQIARAMCRAESRRTSSPCRKRVRIGGTGRRGGKALAM